MKRIFFAWLAVALPGLLIGCNSVYFYETEKMALAVEARPDPTAPIAGNLGLKQRVVLITPSTDPASTPQDERGDGNDDPLAMRSRDAQGDALSVLNSFRLRLHPREQGRMFSRMTIDGALITGRPARQLSAEQSARAIAVLTGGETAPVISHDIAILRMMLDGVKTLEATLPDDSPFRLRIESLFARLRLLDDLAPPRYDTLIFDRVENHTFIARPLRGEGDPIAGEAGLDRVLTYWADLDDSVTRLAKLRDDTNQPELTRLAAGRKHDQVSKTKADLESRLHRSEVLNQLRTFWNQVGR